MEKKEKRFQIILAIAVVVLLYLVLEGFGITCPIKFLTGISCAGCGMSRAWMAVFHLDFARAFYFHPLFFTPPVILLVILLKKRIKPAFYKGFIFTMIALYVIVYLYRMIWGDHQVVVFILLSFITCGIYAYYWYYKLGNRLAANAIRYNLNFQENGTTVLMWCIFGAFLCGIGQFVAMHILIKNSNMICAAYNRSKGL